MRVNGIRIDGHSVSGYTTTLVLPEHKLLFDCGDASRRAVRHRDVAITHGHLDHFGDVARHANIRHLLRTPPSRFFVPPWLEDPLHKLISLWGAVQEAAPPFEAVVVAPGERAPLGKKRFLEAFPTDHNLPSQGYRLIEQRRKLKPEYVGTPGPELGRLRKEGVEIEDVTEVVLFIYSGDTRAAAYDDIDLTAKVAVLECTFLWDKSVEEAHKKGHTHISELADRADLLDNTESVLLTHPSARYCDCALAEAIERLPTKLREKTTFLPFGGCAAPYVHKAGWASRESPTLSS